MKRFFILALMTVSVVVVYGQILYSISGNGLKKPSYIIGTHHLTDAKFLDQVPGIDKALKNTKQVYGELKMADMTNPDTLKMMQTMMMFQDGTSIKDWLSADDYEKLNKVFETLAGVRFDNPMIFEAMGKMRPSAIETQITVFAYMKSHPMAFDPLNGLDGYIQKQAKQTYGLESYEFQAKLLYRSENIDDEVRSLICTINNIDELQIGLEKLTEAYKAQDVEMIEKVMNTSRESKCSNPEATEKLIEIRNKNWIQQMPAIMKKNPTFFVVGAGHLFGERGVLQMLKDAGYTINPVK